MVYKKIIIALFFFISFSCSGITSRYDLNINGAGGVVVFPERESYNFHIISKGNLDYFFVSNCHRYHGYQDAANVTKTIFKIKQKNEIKLTYIPTDLEKGFCPLEFAAFDKNVESKGKVFFKQADLQLEANISCNGENYDSKGVSACQAKRGTTQSIKFKEDVSYISSCLDNSGVVDKNGKAIKYKKYFGKAISLVAGPNDMCSFYFKGEISGKRHRLTILSFDKVDFHD